MSDREKVIKAAEICLKHIDESDCPQECPYFEQCSKYEKRVIFQPLIRDALALLKEQDEQIKNRDESLEKARAEIKWLRGMQKDQDAIEGTIEETRGEWPDETLPVSRNKEREYPCDHSRRNKA